MKRYILALFLILNIAQTLAEPTSLETIVNSEISFSKNFSNTIYNNYKGNVVCSPLSAYLVLAQATYGADEDTAKQLYNALSLSKDIKLGLDGFKSLRSHLKNISDVELKVANKLILYKNFELNETYVNEISYAFGPEISAFNGTPAALVNEVNNWVESETNNMIHELIKEDDIDEKTTKLIILNAVHFNAKWRYPFDATKTIYNTFTDLNNTQHNVKTMTYDGYPYLEHGVLRNLNAKYVEIPYLNDDFKLVIIMPLNEVVTAEVFDKLGEELQKNNYNSQPKYNQGSSADLHLPKFKIESQFDLKPVLSTMKAVDMFSDKANFKKMIKNHEMQLKISKFSQKAMIDVNEVGSEAGAASIAIASARSMPDLIEINKPFYFSIESKKYGVLFQGRVDLPSY